MKKYMLVLIALIFADHCFSQLSASFEKDTLILYRDNKLISQTLPLIINVDGVNSPDANVPNILNFEINTAPATTLGKQYYKLNAPPLTLLAGIRQAEQSIEILRDENSGQNPFYVSVQMSYRNPVAQIKQVVIKIIGIKEKPNEIAGNYLIKGRVKDTLNYLKAEIVQYSDILGIKNDLPNGLLQYQGIFKIATNGYKYRTNKDWTRQWFRSVVLDATINRVDKSKAEIDYNYTAFIYENNQAKKTSHPWLATTDIYRFSNFQVGIRVVPLTLEKGNFRIQFQGGVRLLKNQPFSEDTVRSGQDSGKVKSDFRAVYSGAVFGELFIKNINTEKNFDISFNTGLMWLYLMDSYYKQIEIHQQDPFQRTIALATVNGSRKNSPMWFTSLRLGYLIGEEKMVSTFVRLSYMLQTGKYLEPLSTIVDGRPVAFEEKRFYNNFMQVHLGTTIEISKLFDSKEKKKLKEDGTISNSL